MDPKDRAALKQKGLNTMDQFIRIDYHVTQAHLVGYLAAQTKVNSEETLERIKPQLVDLAEEIFREKPQKASKPGG
jgi:hypothetical protein